METGVYKHTTAGTYGHTERQLKMGEKKESKLQHVMKISWESEQMPGWNDSLSMVLETTKKEFQIKSKDVTAEKTENRSVTQDDFILEEEMLV